MFALLLIFGVIVAAAGIALVGSGVSVQTHTFDPTVITPGMVAIVGGLLLIGVGVAIRQLARIERTLAARPTAGTAQPNAIVAGVAAKEQPSANELPTAPTILFPAKPAAEPTETPAAPELPGIAQAPMTAAAHEAERLREKFPSLLRLENPPVVDEADVSLLPKPPVRADEEVAETGNVRVGRQAPPSTPAANLPRIATAARTSSRPERVTNLDAFWPRRRRPGQGVSAAAVESAMPAPTAEPASVVALPVVAPEVAHPVSILKSGVVDGMAYTLYSDGSIEAQLPQGTLRFGSITELRNHIEQSA
jgi:hypothetical protein